MSRATADAPPHSKSVHVKRRNIRANLPPDLERASLSFYGDPKSREGSSGFSAALALVPEAVVPYQSLIYGEPVGTSCLSRASQRSAVAPITWSASALPQAAPFSKSPSMLAIWFVT